MKSRVANRGSRTSGLGARGPGLGTLQRKPGVAPSRRRPADLKWAARLVELAGRGAGRVAPNPPVGAMVVRRGVVIAEGWHAKYGGPHAEVAALRTAGELARGATLHCSLEPCCHQGKTPPCTDAIIAAGIRRVVYYARDPNPKVRDRARRILARRGVACVFRPDPFAESLIRGFSTWIRTGRPRVELKAAVSLDGRIADHRGFSRGLGNAAQINSMMARRADADAILVGVGTVKRDDPRLTVRGIGRRQRLIRVVLDRRLEIPARAKLFATLGAGPVWIVTDPARIASRSARRLARRGAVLLPIADRGTRFIPKLLDELGRRGVTQLLVEGGATVLGRFVRSGHYDCFRLYQMPLFLGEHGVPLVRIGRVELARAIRGKFERDRFKMTVLLPDSARCACGRVHLGSGREGHGLPEPPAPRTET